MKVAHAAICSRSRRVSGRGRAVLYSSMNARTSSGEGVSFCPESVEVSGERHRRGADNLRFFEQTQAVQW
jgi:hypothetical protein